MKVYFPIQDFQENRAEILSALRSIFEKQFPGFRTDPVFSLNYDREDQFFLKSPYAILWGKVFFGAVTREQVGKLKVETEALAENFESQVQFHVFFPQRELATQQVSDYPRANYFHYSFIQSAGEKAMLIERLSFPENSLLSKHNRASEGPLRTDYSFSKQSQLTRNELAELIDLSLDLKRS